MWSHFFVDRSEKGTKCGARKLLTTSWESSWIHFIIWQDVMEKIYKISWCCRNRGCLNGNQSITALISWKCCFLGLDGQFSANTSTDCHRIGFFIYFFFGRDALSSLRQNQDTYLTDTKIRKSLFDEAGELFNEITNRLIIVEIFYAIILD